MANIQDGSAAFKIRDLREEKLKQKMVDLVYPVGIVVALANDKKPAFMEYGTWEKVAEGRVLQGASDSHAPGTKVEAGLPNITGEITGLAYNTQLVSSQKGSGAFRSKSNGTGSNTLDAQNTQKVMFDASLSNDIYGKSETVQPPAYVVAYWQRTA